ncbi:chemotaxis-specific protein-glutamate methyltransferase CheB [Couchioplanes caeruleus]|uniref:chemotaxis-specific protein-glutamate methyltransferase CheB n=1 Tax=Couchioplanes caeruleus TaxID=56438 RepID=UPI00201C9946|nr:chemotaxis-specific protein-glutamate methyltransferase CheB [Couchioplanes caeruleus]UQU67905.1 chemotaxis-specific protein-glutamate methyltransferase CheB [Couchioplanes caeruleus]
MTGILIVDESAVVRQVLAALLRASPGLQVLAAVPGPGFAAEHLRRAWPDVIVLGLTADGLGFLRRIMAERPTPVVVCAAPGTSAEALAAGAAAVIAKPATGLKRSLERDGDAIVAAIRAAAGVRERVRVPEPALTYAAGGAPAAGAAPVAVDRVVAVGTSTGGTQALEVLLPALPATCPGVVLVQHMPAKFTSAFAERLDALCRVRVKEAADGDPVLPGQVLVAPGGRHMELRRADSRYAVRVFEGPPVNRHCPSVDVLFHSVARAAGPHAVGVIMTGMGDDGARGLLEMRRAGAYTVAQDEATCVVHGMPREAVLLGAVDRESPLGSIAEVIFHHG